MRVRPIAFKIEIVASWLFRPWMMRRDEAEGWTRSYRGERVFVLVHAEGYWLAVDCQK
jgi:hypothetical protein